MTPHPSTNPTLQVDGHLASITLRRPKAINALHPSDIEVLTPMLTSVVADPAVQTILLRGEGERGLCAGGDIKEVHAMISSGDLDRLAAFWSAEYRLDHLIATCPKPVVTIAHGLTLGAGVGLASHTSHRVVTDSTRIGMPEVLIGLVPDVGGLWLYSRAPGHTGTFAALTSAHLSAGDALYMGLADHYVPEHELDGLVDELRRAPADVVLAPYGDRPASWIEKNRDDIDTAFGADTFGEIVERAGATGVPAEALTTASPTALHVTREALRRAAEMTELAQCLQQDLVVGLHCAQHPDLAEGIRARVVDKDRCASPAGDPQRITAAGEVDLVVALRASNSATAPITVMAGGAIPASATAPAMSASVPRTTR
jgi:enoyl-CoA hydratase